ncbi:hypothetical protein B0H14DRAFT_382212 [Mycena olivaceomarginata]|nr:hypothetical protein B0H14DRAFT_382212 [Mycena olivaceomarginata]
MLRLTPTQPLSSQMISPASNSSSSSSESSSSSHGTLSSATSFRSQTPRSPVHAASLVDSVMHSPELMQLVEVKLSRPVIEYVVDCVLETVDQALARSGLRLLSAQRASSRSRFAPFVATLLSRATVRTPTLLVALVYISRARPPPRRPLRPPRARVRLPGRAHSRGKVHQRQRAAERPLGALQWRRLRRARRGPDRARVFWRYWTGSWASRRRICWGCRGGRIWSLLLLVLCTPPSSPLPH